MANYQDEATWEANVYIIAENDPVQGGENGIDNIPHQQLANRTAYLKKAVETVDKKVADLAIPADHSQAIQALQDGLADEIKAREDGDKAIVGQPTEPVTLASLLAEIKQLKSSQITSYMIPVGGLFETTKAYANASELATDMGYGTWEQYGEGRVTIAKSSKYALGQMGGEEEVTLTKAQMPKHTHKSFMTNNGDVRAKKSDPLWKNLTDYIDWDSVNVTADLAYRNDDVADSMFLQSSRDTGGDQPHNNMQPFVVVGRWVRTA